MDPSIVTAPKEEFPTGPHAITTFISVIIFTQDLHSVLVRSPSEKLPLAILAEDIPGLPDPGRGPELGIGRGIGKKGAGARRARRQLLSGAGKLEGPCGAKESFQAGGVLLQTPNPKPPKPLNPQNPKP